MIIEMIKKLTLCTRTNSKLLTTKPTSHVAMDEKALRPHGARIVYFIENNTLIFCFCFQNRAGCLSFLAT